jgi:hypothetical protein
MLSVRSNNNISDVLSTERDTMQLHAYTMHCSLFQYNSSRTVLKSSTFSIHIMISMCVCFIRILIVDIILYVNILSKFITT